MTHPALTVIEEVYEMGMNPTQPYYAQLEMLAASGELANRIQSNKVLFKLCEIIDRQEQEIQRLKADREAIAQQMVSLDKKIIAVVGMQIDPTKPIAP